MALELFEMAAQLAQASDIFIFPLVSQEHLSQDYSKDGEQNEGTILPPFVVHGLLWSTFDGSASFRRVLLMINSTTHNCP
jgi:hypothetical protein